MESKVVLVGLAVLVIGPSLRAQQFKALRRESMPLFLSDEKAQLVDLDGDGALDIQYLTRYLHNNGRGHFEDRPLSFPFSLAGRSVPGDFDGDGDQDVATYRAVLHNRGALGPVWIQTSPAFQEVPIIGADFNGDGRTDLVTSHGVAIATSLTTFQVLVFGSGSINEAAIADFDGDGDLDVFAVGSGSTATPWSPASPTRRFLWRNNGGGSWVAIPLVGQVVYEAVMSAFAYDFDGDGLMDCGFRRASTTEFWLNQGAGVFRIASGVSPVSGSPCDFDLDGDLDRVVDGGWYENLGPGSYPFRVFSGGTNITARISRTSLQAVGDVNGDQWPDLVFASAFDYTLTPTMVLLNQGPGQNLIDVSPTAWLASPDYVPSVGDLNGDGSPDILVGSSYGGLLWRNGGDGWLESIPSYTAERLADLDGDGDLDAFSPWFAMINDGTGGFTMQNLAVTFPSQFVSEGQHAFDADGDGAIDMVYVGGPVLCFMRNVGNWTYAAAPTVALPSSGVTASAAADFDLDGDVDLLVGMRSPAAVAILRNDGRGAYAVDASGVLGLTGNATIRDLVVVDVDGDGDRDIFVGRSGGTNPTHVLLRNAGGVLTADPTALPTHAASTGLYPSALDIAVRTGDVDGDGDADAIVRAAPGELHLWRNDGTGHFATAANLLLYYHDPLYVEDFDFDGDADLVTSTSLLTNRQWHIEAPFAPQVGMNYVYRCGGIAMPNAVAMPWIGSPSHQPVPGYGTLGVDLQTAAPLGWLFLNGEMAEGSVAVPANAGLLGLRVSIQALLVGANGEMHLTPAKHETIRW